MVKSHGTRDPDTFHACGGGGFEFLHSVLVGNFVVGDFG